MAIAAVLRAASKHGASFDVNDTGLVVHGGNEQPLATRRCIEQHESTFRIIALLQGLFRWLLVEHQAYLAGERDTYNEQYNQVMAQFELGQRLLRVVQEYEECIWGDHCATDGPLVCSACTMVPKPKRWRAL